MNFFNFGDSPDRSKDTSFTFSFREHGDGGIKDENHGSSRLMIGSAEELKQVFKADTYGPVLKKTKVEKQSQSPVKRSPEKTLNPEQIYHHEGKPTEKVSSDKSNGEISKDVAKEEIQPNVNLMETMNDCMDDIRKEFSSFLPALQTHKVRRPNGLTMR